MSVLTPAWMWLRCPAWRAIFLSANPRVALRDSVYCREVLESPWYRETFRPGWSLASDQNAKGLFHNTAGGYRAALGWTSRIIGQRADALVVDDPHDAQEAMSDAIRTGVVERWDASIANRVNDLRSSVRIGIMQRVHELDWSGHVLKQGDWEHLCLPQEFEPARARTTVLGWQDPRTGNGELLFPERFPPDVLRREKLRLGSYGYAGQHQQRPAPAEGGTFKRDWFRSWTRHGDLIRLEADRPRTVRERDLWRFGVIDLAFSTRTEADYTVISAWGVSPDGDLVLLDLVREQMEGPDILPLARRMYREHGLQYFGVEQNGAQLSFAQSARRADLPIRALRADVDKVRRAIEATIRMEARTVFFPESAPWLADLKHEMLNFPNGAHDDMVDVVAYAAIEVMRRHGPPADHAAVSEFDLDPLAGGEFLQ